MDTNRVPQPRHDGDSVEGTTPASSAPVPAWTAGCSLAALSSPSTTLMVRSSSTSACRVVVATRRAGHRAGVLRDLGPYNSLGRAGAPLWCGLRFAATTGGG